MGRLKKSQHPEIAKKYLETDADCPALAKEYGVSPSRIGQILKLCGVETRKPALTAEQEEEIAAKYSKGVTNCQALSKEYDVPDQRIVALLKKRGIPVINDRKIFARKYTLNEEYWANGIDSDQKAYFLGLLISDGNVCDRNNCVSIALQERDAAILIKLNEAMGSNGPLVFQNKKSENWQNSYKVRFHGEKIVSQLAALSCHPRKSMVLTFPTIDQVPSEYVRHFIRGFFCGNGCVYVGVNEKHGNPVIRVSIVSTKAFCDELQKIVTNATGVKSTQSINNPREGTPIRTWYIGGTQQALKFLRWLYADTDLYIQRKYDKFKEVEAEIESRKALIEAFGEKKRLADWGRDPRCSVSPEAISVRLANGWLPEKAITEPKTDTGRRKSRHANAIQKSSQ